MKKLLLPALGLFLMHIGAQAQIATLPETQSFDDAFSADSGTDVQIYPNYYANEVQSSSRIFRDTDVYNSAPAAISIIPTGSFDGELIVHFDLTSYSNVLVTLVAKSMANGTGTRPAKLSVLTSVDGGNTWINEQELGQFPNEDQADFTDLSYTLPTDANNQSDVQVKFLVETGDDGSGTRAKLVMDDIMFAETSVPQVSADETALDFDQVVGFPSAAHHVDVSGLNLTSDITLTTAAPFEISLDENTGYTTSLTLTQTDGVVDATAVYVRMNASAEGQGTGTLSIESTGAETTTVDLTGMAVVATATNPAPFDLSTGDYTFTEWSADAEHGTYPANMAFWTHSTTDPDITTLFMEDYTCLYNLTSRSRFNGLGTAGVSMINTGNSQYVGVCDGSDPEQDSGETVTYGRAGAIVLALNTTNRQQLSVTWTARTVTQNNRTYSLRIQYRTSADDVNSGWMDIPGNDSDHTEYISDITGDEATFTTMLPADAENKPVVEVRWVYNLIDTGASGSRSEVSLDDVTVTSQDMLAAPSFENNNKLVMYPNPANGMVNFNHAVTFDVYDYTGKLIQSAKEATSFDVSAYTPGIYIVKTSEGLVNKLIVK